jgi:hypothetical protein
MCAWGGLHPALGQFGAAQYRRVLIADITKPKTPKGLYIYRWQVAQVPTPKGLYVKTLVEHKTPLPPSLGYAYFQVPALKGLYVYSICIDKF